MKYITKTNNILVNEISLKKQRIEILIKDLTENNMGLHILLKECVSLN